MDWPSTRVRRWRRRAGLSPYAATAVVILILGSLTLPWFALLQASRLPPGWDRWVAGGFVLMGAAGLALAALMLRVRPRDATISALMVVALLAPTLGFALALALDAALIGPMTMRILLLVIAAGVVIRSRLLLAAYLGLAVVAWVLAMLVAGASLAEWRDWATPWLFAVAAAALFRILFEAERRRDDAIRVTLESRAQRDPLTGVLNREGFASAATDACARAGVGVWCAFVDVDGLKQVNDRHGHDAGDEVIRAVADALVATIREHDVVARWGGDEFVVLGPGLAPEPIALEQRLVRRLHACGPAQRGAWAPVVTVGVASRLLPDPDEARSLVTSLVTEADREMYAARGARRAADPG